MLKVNVNSYGQRVDITITEKLYWMYIYSHNNALFENKLFTAYQVKRHILSIEGSVDIYKDNYGVIVARYQNTMYHTRCIPYPFDKYDEWDKT